MGQIYVSGNYATISKAVASGVADVVLGTFVDIDSGGTTFRTAASNSSSAIGIAYAGDYKGKYTSGSGGTGIGSAVTQSSIDSGDRVTVISKGCGAIVRGISGTSTTINAGNWLKIGTDNATGYVCPIANTDSTAALTSAKIGMAVTQQTSSGGTVDILLC